MSDKTLPLSSATAPVRGIRVVVLEGPDEGLTREVEGDTLGVGTARDNGLVLSDDTVSRYHLELRQRGAGIEAADLGSTNGTVVGPVRIERAVVDPGTTLRLGKTRLRVESAGTRQIPLTDGDRLGGLRGRSTAMRKLMAEVERVARSEASVLVLGETGAGKEVVARTLHDLSPRAAGPFETVDCGVLAPALIASELFGHERGAFTGADQQRVGAFERAHGGTLFLDEIGELPAALQASLLGALERRTFKRVGGDKPINVNVRVVCATNRDLRSEVNAGTFRQDLYYRIAVVMVRIPPLRERKDDIPLLAEHFLRLSGYDGPVEALLPPAVVAALLAHRWPGNVRELRNFVDAAIAIGAAPQIEGADEGPPEGPEDAPSPPAARGGAPFPRVPLDEILAMSFKDARDKMIAEFEEVYVRALLERCGNNVSRAARVSDIHRSYLNLLLKRYGLR